MQMRRSAQRWLLGTTAALVMPLASARAQLTALEPGVKVRVRVTGVSSKRITGVVLARTADSITLSDVPNRVVPTAALTEVEISRGKSRRRGAVKGMAWGTAIAGTLLGLATLPNSNCSREPCKTDSNGEAAFVMLAAGVMYGGGIGALVKSERWEKLSLSSRVGLATAPGGRGLGVSVRW